ncbi:MAG: FtsK/SpoIIIE domain-containing protein [Cellulomonas sp.]
MRLTLAGPPGMPDVDLDVPDDARLGDLRPYLAAVTDRAELADDSVALAVDETVLDADQLTGQVPLLAGAILRVGAGPVDRDRAALRAAWHVAVVAGPDCGALFALEATIVVGRAGDLAIDDVGMSRRHVELTVGRSGPRARDLGSSNGTERSTVRSRHRGHADAGRRLGPLPLPIPLPLLRGVRLRDGDRLTLGATVLELRRGGSAAWNRAPSSGSARSLRTSTGGSRGLWLGPAIGSLVLALSTGNRLLLALALVGPTVVAGPWLRDRLTHRRVADRPPPHTAAPALGHPTLPDEPPSPADLSTRAVRLLLGARTGIPAGARGSPHAAAHDGPRDGQGSVPPGAAPPGGSAPLRTPPGGIVRSLAPDGCLAVVGPRALRLAVTRALVAASVPVDPSGSTLGLDLVVVEPSPTPDPDWSWCRWLLPSPTDLDLDLDEGVGTAGSNRAEPALVLAHGARGEARLDVARRWDGGRGTTVLILEPTRADLPAWCRTVLTVRAGTRHATLELPDGTVRTLPLHAVSVAWAQTYARRIAALRRQVRPHGELPRTVALADLPGIPIPRGDDIAARWHDSRPRPGGELAFCLGRGIGGRPVVLDLVRDGPHALVAGTTGAGKSELLQTMLLSLALTHSPADLAIALIDYKGGASFGVCADLPHVVGQVTDLDPGLAARALTGLRAELRGRERLLAAAGVSDLAALQACGPDRHPAPPRLLVVVDEFRALTEELPTFIPGLLRVAAQGRSLGIHLVLATQRPAGAVGADLRANLALRIALRVTDAADSLDVVEVTDAARIPAALPGRAIVRRGAGPPERVQVAHADGVVRSVAEVVRRAPAWTGSTAGPAPTSPLATTPPPAGTLRSPTMDRAPSPARAFVDAARAAAAAMGVRLPEPPWLPPLPTHVSAHDLTPAGAAGTTASLPLALADVPAAQRRAVLAWDPTGGPLLVLGSPGSGRSRTLHTLARAALAGGWHVHTVGLPSDLVLSLGRDDPPGLGTVVDPDDPRRLARLVTLLASAPGATAASGANAPRQLLILDGLDAVLAALGGVARGAGADRLVDLLRTGRGRGVAIVATAGPALSGPLVAPFAERLVLAVGDRLAEVLAGVPADLAGSRRGPGRAIRLPATGASVGSDDLGAVLCQVAVWEVTAEPGADADPGQAPRWAASPSTERAWRLMPLPPHARRSDVPDLAAHGFGGPDRSNHPVVGLGGDDAGPVRLDVSRGALVIGPPGSGRSTALATLATALLDGGRPVAVIARDGPVREVGEARAPGRTVGFTPAAIGRLLDGLPAGSVVLVDDLEALEVLSPATEDRLAAVVNEAAAVNDVTAVRVVASVSTARAAIAYRGTLGALRAVRAGLVLAPATPGSGEVFGVPLDWVVDTARPHTPGRGVCQHGRDLVAVQVLDPEVR